jgi:hypothetical protein
VNPESAGDSIKRNLCKPEKVCKDSVKLHPSALVKVGPAIGPIGVNLGSAVANASARTKSQAAKAAFRWRSISFRLLRGVGPDRTIHQSVHGALTHTCNALQVCVK